MQVGCRTHSHCSWHPKRCEFLVNPPANVQHLVWLMITVSSKDPWQTPPAGKQHLVAVGQHGQRGDAPKASVEQLQWLGLAHVPGLQDAGPL